MTDLEETPARELIEYHNQHAFYLVVPGPPRTKKNSRKLAWSRRQRQMVPVPSDGAQDFTLRLRAAVLELPLTARRHLPLPIGILYHVRALFYIDVPFEHRHYGDLTGYKDAVGDALQAAAVIQDDKLIDSWDGSRRRHDQRNPRTEILIQPLIAVPLAANGERR